MNQSFAFELPLEEVHIWTFPSTAPNDVVETFARVLNTGEVSRAERFRFPHLRESFVIAHGVLRYLVGRYSDRLPAEIRFSFGSKGKPMAVGANGLQFNMTHSGDVTMIALARDCEIGVDVEKIRPLLDMQRIADQFFCVEEAAELRAVLSVERNHAFFCSWTRKEAYVKAIGAGLYIPLNSFRVPVAPTATPRFIHIDHDTTAAREWNLNDLPLAPEYAAALAYRGRQHSLRFFSITDFREFIDLP
jgi:4'-phosphopantetheinyl transferase